MPAAEATSWMLFLDWIGRYRVGDLSSMLGVLISVVGFVVTVWNVLRSKAAALQAREAAEEARRAVVYVDVMKQLSRVTSGIGEIKRMHRDNVEPRLLIEKYSYMRSILVEAKNGLDDLSPRQKEDLRKAAEYLGLMEAKAEQAILGDSDLSNAITNNDTLREIEDSLTELLTSVQKRSGGMA